MRAAFYQFVLLFCLTLLASGEPAIVMQAFEEKYPGVNLTKWELDNNGSWEAHFEKEGIKYRADFNPDGTWIETEHSLQFVQLPSDVKAAIEMKYGSDNVKDIEAVESSTHGLFYDIEVGEGASKVDLMMSPKGKLLDPERPPTEQGFFHKWMDQAQPSAPLLRSGWVLVLKSLLNLIAIFIYTYAIYYRRHHDHKMLFLLLAFNLFLFPIFLSSSLVSAGFGFTIFALLALVRLRSEAFDKAEIAYLLGAISLTFITALLPTGVDLLSAAVVLFTAYFADRRSLWRDSFHKIEVDYRISEKEKMVDQAYLRAKLSEEYLIDVKDISVNRVFKNEIRLTLMYRDLPQEKRAKLAVVREQEREAENKLKAAAKAAAESQAEN